MDVVFALVYVSLEVSHQQTCRQSSGTTCIGEVVVVARVSVLIPRSSSSSSSSPSSPVRVQGHKAGTAGAWLGVCMEVFCVCVHMEQQRICVCM